ncbi:hypothetical protein FB561_3556 [Kribbella amoyensis]|uniref:Uncharacterized protein n=1 Tax=Kribbella amoyensis TaxID=996641 RepID=A0A561BUF7_9ACTN|nr:hypothetical protein [Kribbella amoyensis]TWD82423.1 hypothetical protein FB561_3556 [Kribbella amoyensis]
MSDEAAQLDTWQPPWWLLVFAPFGWLLITGLVLNVRGWELAVVTFVVLAPLGMPIPWLLRLLRRHRRLAGAHVGPVVWAVVILVSGLPIWLCTAVALTALLFGLLVTTMRELAEEPD